MHQEDITILTNLSDGNELGIYPENLEDVDEIDCVGEMVDIAQDNDMLAEVVWSFGQYMNLHGSVYEAVKEALEDWKLE